MTFPSIHFKHKSTDYAPMPYSTDSCFKFIANHFKDNINGLVIWRDTLEKEELTNKRISILKADLRKYIKNGKIEIQSMDGAQKVSRQIITMTSDSTKIKYLLTLNSVFDISKTRSPKDKSTALNHYLRPKIWCWNCWITGFHMDKTSRNLRKMERYKKKKLKTQNKGE
ncbi:MAG: hypothetical protein J0L69_07720 [Bacteroidetes bacterium]|nr:hypothetical protein [Bacteroidota bacterium]